MGHGIIHPFAFPWPTPFPRTGFAAGTVPANNPDRRAIAGFCRPAGDGNSSRSLIFQVIDCVAEHRGGAFSCLRSLGTIPNMTQRENGNEVTNRETALRYLRRARQARFAASRIKDREISKTFRHIADDYDYLAHLQELLIAPPDNPN